MGSSAPPSRRSSSRGCSTTSSSNNNDDVDDDKTLPFWHVRLFCFVVFVDVVTSILFTTGIFPHDGETKHFTIYGSLNDLAWLAGLRILFCVLGMYLSYLRGYVPPEFPFSLYHRNGDKKSREELEQESLEEPFWPWFKRYLMRGSFACEFVALFTQFYCIIKSLVRMNVEIGIDEDQEPIHPIFWLAITFAVLCSVIESSSTDSVCLLLSKYGKKVNGGEHRYLTELRTSMATTLVPQMSEEIRASLSRPLLDEEEESCNDDNDTTTTASTTTEIVPTLETTTTTMDPTTTTTNAGKTNNATRASAIGTAILERVDSIDSENVRGVSDIGADANYKATMMDLFKIIYPDSHLIGIAFIFLVLAALCQILIPRYLGKILDSLAEAFSDDDDVSANTSMFDIPGFMTNVKLLILASILAGIFSGCRGSLFSVVGGRVNVRLRIQLFDSLLSQDIGFFDTTKTGDITSRLSSDTTLVGDQVTLNVNVFLRSLVQAIGVLLFMFIVSWQLSIIAFISVPVVTFVSRSYGSYIRSLTKLMQKKLADGNSICDAALGNMSTVRSFDAGHHELKAFEDYMERYLHFNNKSAIAYAGYAALTTSLPQLVYAVVVFYGGLLVRNHDMSTGELVSFLLYLQSLSDAFAAIGYIFSSLIGAVGAADKVIELMRRKPKMKTPTINSIPEGTLAITNGISGVSAMKTRKQRAMGIFPRDPGTNNNDNNNKNNGGGCIELKNVEMYYPARPQRCVLNDMSLKIEPGSVVALVGQSGGGKSSVMSLIQHLYEPSKGRVLIDGIDVHNISPAWLSRHVSIVSQEPTLFAKSLRSNIIYGLENTNSEPTQAEVEEAAKLANAHEFIERMPFKYDTDAGEGGVTLSGGQKQRIAIARALVRKPKVLLLDEATSALDAESEHLVQQAIDGMLARGRRKKQQESEKDDDLNENETVNSNSYGYGGACMTVVIVAHRLSTVRKADCIFVVKDGQVVESGNHDELIKNPDGQYASLIRRQMDAQNKLENPCGGGGSTNGDGEGGGASSAPQTDEGEEENNDDEQLGEN